MEILAEKILAAAVIVVLSLVFGFLPQLLSRKYDFSSIDTTDPAVMKKEKKKLKNVALSFLLNLGGGVLIANCFCHWLPEVREGLDGHENLDTFLPLAEVIMCSGFFFISGLEEVLHHFLHPHQIQEKESKIKMNSLKETSYSNGAKAKADVTDLDEKDSDKTAAQIKAAIRTVFVVSALSFHSTIEGLALSLESESAGVWLNTGATALHKFVISFSVGVELISNKVSMMMFSISIIVFSFAPAVGSAIGIVLTELSFDSEKIDLPLQILQGIATGTIVYVVFFEIIPKAKSVGGTGKQHILAMVIGFAMFLPSLYFHSVHEHDHEDPPVCKNLTGFAI
eukprot:TRINITY_DN17525_c0_g1_i1.p1 TRINITY_DN17525_c0_g1~~TRINITY_DN17525_c0_g1_i1.p1  ORF type:complete len:339 (-),score=68.34 TRINITY_DN17525_c0_g1_i1:97-1113(-)